MLAQIHSSQTSWMLPKKRKTFSKTIILDSHRSKKDGDHDRIWPPEPVSASRDARDLFQPQKSLPNMVHVTRNFAEMRNCRQKSEDQKRQGPYLVTILGAEITSISTQGQLPNMVMVPVLAAFINGSLWSRVCLDALILCSQPLCRDRG